MAFEYEPYLWKETNLFLEKWFPQNGYRIEKKEQFDDYIAYRTMRRGEQYTIFAFSFGKKKRFPVFDADLCMPLIDLPIAQLSTVLVLYLQVEETTLKGDKTAYKVQSCYGNDRAPELWQPTHEAGRNMLLFYPRKEVVDMIDRFCAAFNTCDQDIFDTIFSEHIHWEHLDGSSSYNNGVYLYMDHLRENNGMLEIAYGRTNDVVYCKSPLLNNLGIIGFSVNKEDRIDKIQEYKNDYFQEIIETGTFIEESKQDNPNKIENITFFKPEITQKYAVNLKFDTGETKKHRFPMSDDPFDDEVSQFRGHVFTQKIFQNGYIENNRLCFYNGFSISSNELYHASVPFYEAEIKNIDILENEKYVVKHIFTVNNISLNYDPEANIFRAFLPNENGLVTNWNQVYFESYNCKLTCFNVDGTRATNLEFTRFSEFHEGLASVLVPRYNYAYVDKDIKFTIPPEFYEAYNFKEGLAIVMELWGETKKWFIINHDGKKTCPEEWNSIQAVTDFKEGLARFSIEPPKYDFQVWNIGDYSIAGLWGFFDNTGKTIIKSQYLFATDFEDGRAVVCKKEPKPDDSKDDKTYHDYNERWGVIDKNGNEIIPCIYDEVFALRDDSALNTVTGFAIHEGGWKKGKWGALDLNGKRIAPSRFEKIGYQYRCNYLIFYKTNRKVRLVDDAPMGVYDVKRQKIIIKPIYEDIDILDENQFCVEYRDQKSKNELKTIIDNNGKTIIAGNYSLLHERQGKFIARINENANSKKYIVLDRTGKQEVVLGYDPPEWASNPFGQDFVFIENGKEGLKDFNGNTIVPPSYDYVRRIYNAELFEAGYNKDGRLKIGVIDKNGSVIIQFLYDSILFNDGYVQAKRGQQTDVFKIHFH